MTDLILASASQVRATLLRNAGVEFSVEAAAVDEELIKQQMADSDAAELAGLLADAKARKISARHPGALVIGADQILECDGQLFDKPEDRAGAADHLRALSGNIHHLITAACVLCDGEVEWQKTSTVRLTMRVLSDQFIDRYLDRAGDSVLRSVGAYRLEDLGAQLFTDIDGDYFTILGLPLLSLLDHLRRHGVIET